MLCRRVRILGWEGVIVGGVVPGEVGCCPDPVTVGEYLYMSQYEYIQPLTESRLYTVTAWGQYPRFKVKTRMVAADIHEVLHCLPEAT